MEKPAVLAARKFINFLTNMNKFENPPEKPKASDMEIVLWISGHIMEPCGDSEGKDVLRKFYLQEAKEFLDKLTDPEAKKLLQNIIDLFRID